MTVKVLSHPSRRVLDPSTQTVPICFQQLKQNLVSKMHKAPGEDWERFQHHSRSEFYICLLHHKHG